MSPTRGAGRILRRVGRFVPTLLVVAGLVGVAPRPALAAGCHFKSVKHPGTAATPIDQLYGIDALSAKSIWAVGSRDAAGGTLVEHYNGKKWTIVKSPDKSGFTELEDVAAITAKNVWAVGYYVPSGSGRPRTLIEHYNGKKWTIVKSPNPLSNDTNVLFGVDAVSATNVWAVGGDNLDPGVGAKSVILRFNGSKWVTSKGAALPQGGGLADVSAISMTNVVAVGHAGAVGSGQPLIERFNGKAWSVDTVPSTSGGSGLLGVSTRGAGAQWAVGTQSGTAALQTLALRNTGSGWVITSTPNATSTEPNVLNGVAAVGATKAWAVGFRASSTSSRRTLIERFSAGAWSIVNGPNNGTGNNQLNDVVAIKATNAWAVGTASHPIGSTGIIAHGC